MATYILAIDQGTTSSRALVVDATGAVVAIAQQPVEMFYPQPGWVEQDATNLWQTVRDCCRDAIARAGLTPADIAAIGITNQRETTVLWDRATLQPVARAIVWQSRQTAPLVDAIRQRGMADDYQRITGLVPDAYFSATKIAWLLDTVPGLRTRAERGEIAAGTVDSWLVANLTAGREHLIEVSNASRTMLLDLHTLDWSQPLLDDLRIPRDVLPRVVDSSGALAVTDPAVLGAAIPITGIAGDQQAALFGQTCFAPGQAKNTYGTGSFMLMQTGERVPVSTHRLLATVALRIGGVTNYALEGAIFVTGAAVGWLRDGLGIIDSAADVELLAASVPDSAGVVFVPALSGLGAPWWDQRARGTIVGLTRGTTRAHIARATLEAIAFQTRDVLDAMTADSGVPVAELRVDGGAAANDLLMQLQADLLGVPVVRPAMLETTALGAAYLAGLGAGVWSSQADLASHWRVDRRFEPAMAPTDRDARYATWRRAVARALDWETQDA